MLTPPEPAASIGFPPSDGGTHPLRPLLAVLAGLALAGCAGAPLTRPVAPLPPLRAASLEEVVAAYDAFCTGASTLSASGNLDVRDRRTGRSRSLGVRVVAARGGRLYLKGSIAVITALEVVSNGERFWFQVPSRHTVWTGPAAGEAREAEADSAPYYALRPSDVTAALLPEPLAPSPSDTLLLEGDREAFTVTTASLEGGRGLVRRRVSVARGTLLPARVRTYDGRGNIASDVTYAAWTEGRPRDVLIRRPQEGYEAEFRLDKVQANAPAPERAFAPRLPEGYKVVEVR